MIIASHNSWSYLKPRTFWQKLIRFTAKCQKYNIREQYDKYNTKCFDLRIRFNKNNKLVIAHGKVEYNYSMEKLYNDLEYLNNMASKRNETVYVRVLNEVRKEKDRNYVELTLFRETCYELENKFKNLYFWCGRNLCGNWEVDYIFNKPEPACEEKYSSVMKPRIIDDWYPLIYAKLNNKKIIKQGTKKDILMIDFVNIQ